MRSLLLGALLCLGSFWMGQLRGEDDPAKIETIGPSVRAPIVLNSPAAKIPDEARDRGEDGICLVKLIVNDMGEPAEPHVVRCTDQIFKKNSIAAVMQYKFRPATRVSDQSPVSVGITVEIEFHLFGPPMHHDPATHVGYIGYAFLPPPAVTSPASDKDGIYPLSKQLEEPKFTELEDRGFGKAAMQLSDGVGCNLLLTLDAKGKPLRAQTTNCDNASLSKPAVDTLLKSKYKPARLNGKDVPVCMGVHLVLKAPAQPDESSGSSATSHIEP